MTNKKTSLIILALVLLVGLAYFFGHKNNLGVTLFERIAYLDPKDQINKSDEVAVRNLVKNFYKALEAQDGKLLFSYFTPPSTAEEKTSFNWLTGADLGADPFYRVFMRQKISSPKINDVIKTSDTGIVIKITDQLQGIPSAGNETGVYSPQQRIINFTVIKSGDKWLVDRFAVALTDTGIEKYSGFGQ